MESLKDKNKSNIHKDHRSRMKATFLKNGFEGFSDIEKLEFLLFYGIPQKDTNPIAHRLLDEFGTFDRVLEASYESLKHIEGLGEHTAILINVILQIASAYGKSKCDQKILGTTSAKEFAKNIYKGKFVEEFYIICLNNSNHIIATKQVNKGTSSEVAVDIRSLTKIALANQCERIILLHNHPRGLARPSDEDVAFTSKIIFSCIINNIEVLDHIIVAEDDTFSFEESMILRELKRDALRKLPFDQNAKDKFGQASSNYLIG